MNKIFPGQIPVRLLVKPGRAEGHSDVGGFTLSLSLSLWIFMVVFSSSVQSLLDLQEVVDPEGLLID